MSNNETSGLIIGKIKKTENDDSDDSDKSMISDVERSEVIDEVKYINLRKRKAKKIRRDQSAAQDEKIDIQRKIANLPTEEENDNQDSKISRQKRLRFKKRQKIISNENGKIDDDNDVSETDSEKDVGKQRYFATSGTRQRSCKISSSGIGEYKATSGTRQRSCKISSSGIGEYKATRAKVNGYPMVAAISFQEEKDEIYHTERVNPETIDPYKLSYEVRTASAKQVRQGIFVEIEHENGAAEITQSYETYVRRYGESDAGEIHWPNFEDKYENVSEATANEFFQSGIDKSDADDVRTGFKGILKKERIRWHPDNMRRRLQMDKNTNGEHKLMMERITAVFQILDSMYGQ